MRADRSELRPSADMSASSRVLSRAGASGPADRGPVDGAPAKGGPADRGCADGGPAHDGPANEPANDGPAHDGSAHGGPADSLFRVLAESWPGPLVLLDRDLSATWANEAAATLTGLTP